jgi:hypothetical protein
MRSKIAQKQRGGKSDAIVHFTSSRLVGIATLAKFIAAQR